jgi:hypothetical protein
MMNALLVPVARAKEVVTLEQRCVFDLHRKRVLSSDRSQADGCTMNLVLVLSLGAMIKHESTHVVYRVRSLVNLLGSVCISKLVW